jgi:hypothetical protein
MKEICKKNLMKGSFMKIPRWSFLTLSLLCLVGNNPVLSNGQDLIAAAAYGLVGYKTMSVSKEAGKWVVNDVLKMPKGTANAVTSLDFKFVFNSAIKAGLARGIRTPALFSLALPAITQRESLRGIMFDSANRAVSLTEFITYLGDASQEHIKLTGLPQTDRVIVDGSSLPPLIQDYTTRQMNSAASFFYNTALSLCHDPKAALIAATYLFASWRICISTREIGEAFRAYLGNGNGNGAAMLPLFARGNAPWDSIMSTTVGFVLSSYFENNYVVPTLNSIYESQGVNTTKMHKLNDIAYRAGSKGPFAMDAYDAIRRGLGAYGPPLLHYGSTQFSAASRSAIQAALLTWAQTQALVASAGTSIAASAFTLKERARAAAFIIALHSAAYLQRINVFRQRAHAD